MSFHLPVGTPLGQLELQDVYEYYDFPRIFLARSLSDRQFLALSVEETDLELVWMYVAVSGERRKQIEEGALDLRSAFTSAEDGLVFRVVTSLNDDVDRLEAIATTELDDPVLPAPGEVLRLQVLPEVLEPVGRVAEQRHRETLRFALKLRNMPSLEAPSRVVGQVLTNIQELVFALAQAVRGVATTRGRIPPDILTAAELRVVGFYPASFGVEFASAENADLFGGSVTADALDAMNSLLATGPSEEELAALLADFKPRVASKYRALVQTLVENDVGVRFEWGSVDPERGGVQDLSLDLLRQIAATIALVDTASEETYQVRGTLIGLNSRTRTFEIDDVEKHTRISGRLDPAVFPDDQLYTINAVYRATIRETVEVSGMTGEEKVSRMLISLDAPA